MVQNAAIGTLFATTNVCLRRLDKGGENTMAWNQRDRAQLGEQSSNDQAMNANARNRDVSSEHGDQPVERQTIGQRGTRESIDTSAGDEGIDDAGFAGGSRQGLDRSSRESAAGQKQAKPGSDRSSESSASKSGESDNVHRMAGNEPRTTPQSGSSERGSSSGNVRNNERLEEEAFSGQGGQQGGVSREDREGTGYTGDRRGQLQHDDSLSGSQGRHGKSGRRQGASGSPQTGTSTSDRVGGQTAQNPRESRKNK